MIMEIFMAVLILSIAKEPFLEQCYFSYQSLSNLPFYKVFFLDN